MAGTQEIDDETDHIGEPSEQWYEYQGAPTGTDIECRGWRQAAALRLLDADLDPEVAETPEQLVVDGGTGRAVRSRDAYAASLAERREPGDTETLPVQSGKPVGRFETGERALWIPAANADPVWKWDDRDLPHGLEVDGLPIPVRDRS